MNKVALYGIGDIEKVNFTDEMAIDFKKAYGISINEEIHKLKNIRRFDSLKAKWEADNILHTYYVNQVRANPTMYPEKFYGNINWDYPQAN